MKTTYFNLLLFGIITCCFSCHQNDEEKIMTISKSEVENKIMGGWAGQVIGCTYGGPTEFRFNGTMIQDYVPIPWDNTRCLWYFENFPGLYDDIYMDLTFVDVFEKEGLDAPASSHALAFAKADYMLWHANQAARYNILNGIMPPASGHWLNNPHADDIDFQIEADFAGLMSPGMVNTATAICDKIGHIMNYGDGYYGGVYVASMYSLAFISNDIEYIVTEALKTIPSESRFFKCISDVIDWWKQYPDDWKRTWFECEKKWTEDIGCPDGVFVPFNIDATLNAAYIVIGLLYGEGDFGKTLDISTRCGQDSDCNPASAGGILGTILGYDNIPEIWKSPLKPIENMNFKYTSVSLNDVYKISARHAFENLTRNGAEITGEEVLIPVQEIVAVPLEQCFVGHYPKEIISINKQLNEKVQEIIVEFEGIGFVLKGNASKLRSFPGTLANEALVSLPDENMNLEVYIDGEFYESFNMSTDYRTRKFDVTWKYNMPDGKHKIQVKLLNPQKGYWINISELLTYSSI